MKTGQWRYLHPFGAEPLGAFRGESRQRRGVIDQDRVGGKPAARGRNDVVNDFVVLEHEVHPRCTADRIGWSRG